MDSRWVFVRKGEADDSTRYKARLVIRGFKDVHEYDFTEIYAPVVCLSDVRALLVIANKFDWEVTQMDVDTAFLNGTLNKIVYMKIPDGVKVSEEFRKNKVCKVRKALYGLKVSPKRWYLKFKQVMVQGGFHVFEGQACLFYWRKGHKIVIVMLYVDDILITGNCRDKIRETKRILCGSFKMKILGEPKKFLGIEISRDRDNRILQMKQTKFTNAMLERFELENCAGSEIPMRTNQASKKTIRKRKFESTLDLEKKIPFREAVGALLYCTNCTRPDIAFSVNLLARKSHCYNMEDWLDVEKILKYLSVTKDVGITFYGNDDDLCVFSDASLGTNDELGRSTAGFIVKLFGDPISWGVTKQRIVATSSMEAEYVAMSRAVKEIVYFSYMCRSLIKLDIMPVLYEDNKSAIFAAKAEVVRSLKHIVKLKYHYVRQAVQEGKIKIKWVSTSEQLADIFTKALPKNSFVYFRNIILNYDSNSDQ